MINIKSLLNSTQILVLIKNLFHFHKWKQKGDIKTFNILDEERKVKIIKLLYQVCSKCGKERVLILN